MFGWRSCRFNIYEQRKLKSQLAQSIILIFCKLLLTLVSLGRRAERQHVTTSCFLFILLLSNGCQAQTDWWWHSGPRQDAGTHTQSLCLVSYCYEKQTHQKRPVEKIHREKTHSHKNMNTQSFQQCRKHTLTRSIVDRSALKTTGRWKVCVCTNLRARAYV